MKNLINHTNCKYYCFKSLLLFALLFITPAVQQTAQADANEPNASYKEMQSCKVDHDCVQAPDIYSSCFHYCKEEECNKIDLKDCPLFNRYFKNFPMCVINIACRSSSEGIRCIEKVCRRI